MSGLLSLRPTPQKREKRSFAVPLAVLQLSRILGVEQRSVDVEHIEVRIAAGFRIRLQEGRVLLRLSHRDFHYQDARCDRNARPQ